MRQRKKSQQAQLASHVLFDESDREKVPLNDGTQQKDYENLKLLAEKLLDTLMDLLFFDGFTILGIPGAKGKVAYSIWQSEVGCNMAMESTKVLKNNQCEILRLLLTVTSKLMYTVMCTSYKWHDMFSIHI